MSAVYRISDVFANSKMQGQGVLRNSETPEPVCEEMRGMGVHRHPLLRFPWNFGYCKASPLRKPSVSVVICDRLHGTHLLALTDIHQLR